MTLGHDLSRFEAPHESWGRSAPWVVAWRVISLIVFESNLYWPSTLKVALLRFFGADVGCGVKLRRQIHIQYPWKLRLGSHVWIGDGCRLLNFAEVVIGDNTALAHEVFLAAAGHDVESSSLAYRHAPITIDEGCWITSRVFVGPGVHICAGTIVLPNAAVVSNLPSLSIAGGVPAKIVGSRTIGEDV